MREEEGGDEHAGSGLHPSWPIRTALLTTLALIAFAANSVLCRLALGGQTIDATSFTTVRLLSGAVTMAVILVVTQKRRNPLSGGRWPAGFMLFLYAVTFSFAYITLDTATGALILFASVQVSMIMISLASGERLSPLEWSGATIAFAGFLCLVLPGVGAPSLSGMLLMMIAGVAWGSYTVKGRSSSEPLVDTAGNFARTLPFVAVLTVLSLEVTQLSTAGLIYAVLSGAVASGMGYTIWYAALPGLTGTQAAVVQLLVPIIAAAGGVLVMEEIVSTRLLVSATLVLGGILIVTLGRSRKYSAAR